MVPVSIEVLGREELFMCAVVDAPTLLFGTEVMKAMKSSHALCLPCTVEGFGIVLLEAMVARVPFVASEIQPLRVESNSSYLSA